MNPAERTKEALLAKTESLCNAIIEPLNEDPWGGNGYLSTILRTVKMSDTSTNCTTNVMELPPAMDYAASAGKEGVIREASAGLIKTAQDISTLIRDLQELWLFGGLDTLSDLADEEANQEKAVEVARMIEVLAKAKTSGGVQDRGVEEKGEEKENGIPSPDLVGDS